LLQKQYRVLLICFESVTSLCIPPFAVVYTCLLGMVKQTTGTNGNRESSGTNSSV